MSAKIVDLELRQENSAEPRVRSLQIPGFRLELVAFLEPLSFNYTREDDWHYLAYHDLCLSDGETSLNSVMTSAEVNLQGALTYAPRSCNVSGWSSLLGRNNSFTALSINPRALSEEFEGIGTPGDMPMLYFRDAQLAATFQKIGGLLRGNAPTDPLHLETLCLLAAVEVDRIQRGQKNAIISQAGKLRPADEVLLREWIEANLHRDISLSDLSTLVQLSRFHFARAFKTSFALTPLQFVLHRRIERAKNLLLRTGLPIAEIWPNCGFGGHAYFSAAFKKVTGATPNEFRRNLR